jgi:uncharacterized membrane protein YedE/YeeE
VKAAAAFASGLIFGVGLIVSGMIQPSKVLGFLDVAGKWDPSLMFVMVGAIGVHLTLGLLVRRRGAPWLDARFHLPTRRDLEPRLLGGAAIFGVGWGLVGYCPGPALVGASSGTMSAILFVAAMIGGMVVQQLLDARSERSGRASLTGGEESLS